MNKGWLRKKIAISLNEENTTIVESEIFWKLGSELSESVKKGKKLIFSAVRLSSLAESSLRAELLAPEAVNISDIFVLVV